jgi:hypothetical protein
VNADQAERDRLVQFGEDSVPQLLPADPFGAMPMSWTIVRHDVSNVCARAAPDRHPMGHRPKDRPANYGRRIDERGDAIVYYTSALGRKPCWLSSQPSTLEMVALRVTRCAGTKALG